MRLCIASAEPLSPDVYRRFKNEFNKVEHSLVPEVEESICTLLGHPEFCPDGKKIPRGRCCSGKRKHIDTSVVSLKELSPGERGKITYIKPAKHSNFHQLLSFGLQPHSNHKTQSVCFCRARVLWQTEDKRLSW